MHDDRIAQRFARAGRALLYLAFVSLAFTRPQFYWISSAVSSTDVIAVGAGSCWFVVAAADRQYRRWDGSFAVLLAYFGTMLASALFADLPFTRFGARLAAEAYLLGLPVVVVGLFDGDRHIARSCRAWLTGTARIVALLAVALVVAAVAPQAGWTSSSIT